MVATFESVFVARTQRAAYKRPGCSFVEQPMRETTRGPASPRGDALFDVLGQLLQVVPELHDSSWRTLHALSVDRQPAYGSLDEPSDKFRAPSMVLRSVGHFSTRSIACRPLAGIDLILRMRLTPSRKSAPAG